MAHEPLGRTLTPILNTFAALGYIDVSDIVQTPTNINVEAAQKVRLSDEAISSIQGLPSLSEDLYNLSILPDRTLPVFYAGDDHLGWVRRPTFQDEPKIPGTQFVLTNTNIYGPFKLCFNFTQAHPPEQIIGGWVKNLITLDRLAYGDELIVDPDATELKDATRYVYIVAHYQLQSLQRSIEECYVAAGWNPMASDFEGPRPPSHQYCKKCLD